MGGLMSLSAGTGIAAPGGGSAGASGLASSLAVGAGAMVRRLTGAGWYGNAAGGAAGGEKLGVGSAAYAGDGKEGLGSAASSWASVRLFAGLTLVFRQPPASDSEDPTAFGSAAAAVSLADSLVLGVAASTLGGVFDSSP